MSRALRLLAAVTAAVALTVLVSAATRVPVRFAEGDQGLLRLSWRMAGIAAEACRTLTPEEQERLPVHMRNPRACIGTVASYALEVRIDGQRVMADTVRPPGARGDRPLTVLRETTLSPGRHTVEVRFRALLPAGVEPPPEGIAELGWEGPVSLGAREVALVTLDPSGRRLELRTSRR